MTEFNWLHFTDLHKGMKQSGSQWPGLKKMLFEDLASLHDQCGPWDLVLFTGDLTQQAKPEEFIQVDIFLKHLWDKLKALGSTPYLLAVPGNHDLQRPSSIDGNVKTLTQWENNPDIHEDFVENPDSAYRQLVNHAFTNYTAWWQKQPYRPPTLTEGMFPGDFSYTHEKNGVKLGILGLNGSFLQLTKGDYRKKLLLHVCQFHHATPQLPGILEPDGFAWAEQQHTYLLMTHHPPGWLMNEAKQHLYEILDGGCALHLCGHLHETAHVGIAESGHEANHFWQGHSLFGREFYGATRETRLHGYAAGKISLTDTAGEFVIWPRHAMLQGNRRDIVPDHSIKLTRNKEHTKSIHFDLKSPQPVTENTEPSNETTDTSSEPTEDIPLGIDPAKSSTTPNQPETETPVDDAGTPPVSESEGEEAVRPDGGTTAGQQAKKEVPSPPPPLDERKLYAIPPPMEVFISYADSEIDQDLRKKLEKHLALLKKQKFISTWHKRLVNPSDEWRKVIDHHLESAQIILLLISADFIASSETYEIQMQRAMERYEAGNAQVIPVLLRPVNWQSAPFAKLAPLPDNQQPVTAWSDPDAAFVNIETGIRKAVEALRAKVQQKIESLPARIVFDKAIEYGTDPKPKKIFWINKQPITARHLNQIFNLDPPLEGLNYFDACQYAEWLGGRLASEAEWQLAHKQDLIVSKDCREWLAGEKADSAEQQLIHLDQGKPVALAQQADARLNVLGEDRYVLRMVKDYQARSPGKNAE